MTTRLISSATHEKPASSESETMQEQRVPASVRSGSPVAFLSRIIRLLAANEYSRTWTALEPLQQRLVPRAAYVQCESGSPIPGRLRRIEPLRTNAERVVVPGAGGQTRKSIVVTFRVTFRPLAGMRPAVVRVRAHALRVRGGWAWMLAPERLELHRSGGCGTSPSPGDPSL
jgi:hypothetical protein